MQIDGRNAEPRNHSRSSILGFLCVSVSLWLILPSTARAQKPPEPGYLYPPGGRAGTTVDVQLGGFDWTPDLQFFVFDSRIKLETVGSLSSIFVPPPPYWFGSKSTIAPLPLPREQPARLTLPADLPPGPVRWAVANANGASVRTGIFWVGTNPEVVEDAARKGAQLLPALPVTVSGRLSRIEEVDRYRFSVPKAGPVTCELVSRRLGVDLHGAIAIHDSTGRLLADAVDTEGHDLSLTFAAAAATEYTLSLHDLDFRGDRSFVYRLTLTPGPCVLAAIPAVGRRGETRSVEFVGMGVASGQPKIESVVRQVTYTSNGTYMSYALESPWGKAPAFTIPLSDCAETVAEPGALPKLTVPVAVTSVLDKRPGEARYPIEGKKGDIWDISVGARCFGSPLDVALSVLAPDGKELARNDDLPGTTDAGLTFTVPADGVYTLLVSDQSGTSGSRAAVYRLVVDKPVPDFTLTTVARLNVPIGGTADLLVTAQRKGGFKEPIALTVTGLPEGVTVPPNLVIPATLSQLKISLQTAATAPSIAAPLKVTGTSGTGPQMLTRVAKAPLVGNMAPRCPIEEQTDALLLATTMKPRLKLIAVEADGGRKVHRGTTHPAEVIVERLDGYQGEVSLQMASIQSYQRQGIDGPEMTVLPYEGRVFYPCFMPEWLETTRTSRMALIGVVKVPDPRGKVRYLVTPMSGQITMSIEGSLLKVSHEAQELSIRPGEEVVVPVKVLRSTKVAEAVRLELRLPDELAGVLSAEPVVAAPGQTEVAMRIRCAKDAKITGAQTFTIRGTAMQGGRYAVISETEVGIEIVGK